MIEIDIGFNIKCTFSLHIFFNISSVYVVTAEINNMCPLSVIPSDE